MEQRTAMSKSPGAVSFSDRSTVALAMLVLTTPVLAGLAPGSASELPIAAKEITAYPFFASPERALSIRTNFGRISAGMSRSDVASLLGEPDEVRIAYEPTIKRAKIVGYTYWYVIRRLRRDGSVVEKQEALVRVLFGLDDRVAKVDAWGL
jgi:hypothetical protein